MLFISEIVFASDLKMNVSLDDKRLSKEHKDLETIHELKGPMTRFRAKLLLEEMAKRIKDELLIKGKEGENHKELNWSTLKIVEQHAWA